MQKKKWIIFGILMAAWLAAILISGYLALRYAEVSYEPIAFSKELWDANTEDRNRMVYDLVDTYDLTAMHKDEVLALLGENGMHIDENLFIYETYGGIMEDFKLIFIFDENGKVIEVMSEMLDARLPH